MPSLVVSTAMTANQLGLNIISGWQYEYIPNVPHACKLNIRATTTGARVTITSGSTTIQERSPVQAGGTAGTTPSDLNTAPQSWIAGAGDRIKVSCDEVAAGTPTIDAIIVVEPLV